MNHAARADWYHQRQTANRGNVPTSGGTDPGQQRIRHLAALAREIAPLIDPGLDPLDVARALNWALVRLSNAPEANP
jgi:hypothetical protein